MTRAYPALPFLLMIGVLAGCDHPSDRTPSAPTGTPVLTAVAPVQAVIGDLITLTGSRFEASGNGVKIGTGYVNGVAAPAGTSMTFALPPALSACPPSAQACIALAIVVTPGVYQVTVVNTNGTSDPMTLQVVGR